MTPVEQMTSVEMFEFLISDYADEYEFDRKNHLANASQAVLDELSVLGDAMNSAADLHTVRRMILRMEDRLHIALKLEAAAIEAAEKAEDIPRGVGQPRLFVADSSAETDAALFSSLRRATKSDLESFGYVPRDPVSGIHPIGSIMAASGEVPS